ncbi:hypothetical protein [Streptomyces sp. VNUA74]|uniref:hypothetical protein n=1 Tax=Streptomyces sp. VNUA74 TaxID=3062685 RepID=UPI00280AC4F4|nr:hypothetical protein [Streptomyces sp. VNUA74]WML79158.1 hypothetical protein Q3101_04595 [Streptomyces sp. VNUA74]
MNTDRVSFIYALLDDTGQARYIGCTSRPLDGFRGRAYVHWAHRKLDADRGNTALNAWLRTLDQPPQTLVLEAVPYDQRFKAEAFWTTCFRWVLGGQLLNLSTGARPGPADIERRRAYRHTPETRAKISAAQRLAHERRKYAAAA